MIASGSESRHEISIMSGKPLLLRYVVSLASQVGCKLLVMTANDTAVFFERAKTSLAISRVISLGASLFPSQRALSAVPAELYRENETGKYVKRLQNRGCSSYGSTVSRIG